MTTKIPHSINYENFEKQYYSNPQKYNTGKYLTSMNNAENNFNAKITFSPQIPLTESSLNKQKIEHKSISQNRSNTSDQTRQQDHNFQKANSLRQITKSSLYHLATFINKIGSHNSFMSVIIHFIYKMKFFRNFILSLDFGPLESDKGHPLYFLQKIFIKYPENKKIDISKFRYAYGQVFKNAQFNKFEFDKPNEPCEFYYSFVNLIHSFCQNSILSEVKINDNDENCNCLSHKYLYINIVKHDECECSYINRTKCSTRNCIIDIPIEKVITISNNHSNNIYYVKEKLFSFFKSSIQHSNFLLCPLNGKNCNYNRVKRNLILENHFFPLFLAFFYEKQNKDFFSLHNILHSLLLIPKYFDLENLFVLRDNINLNTQYEFVGIIFQKKSSTFSCSIKCEGSPETAEHWTYYDDENVKIFISWVDLISHCLKNALVPYMIFYQIKSEEDLNNSDNSNMKITKEEFKVLESYALRAERFDEFEKMRKKENLVANEYDLQKIKLQENTNILNSKINPSNNPYKRKPNPNIINNPSYNKEQAKRGKIVFFYLFS